MISPCRLLHIAYKNPSPRPGFHHILKGVSLVVKRLNIGVQTENPDPGPRFRDIPSVRGLDCFVVSLVLFSLYGVYIGQRKDGRNGKS